MQTKHIGCQAELIVMPAHFVVLEGVAWVDNERVEERDGDEEEESDEVHSPRDHTKPFWPARIGEGR